MLINNDVYTFAGAIFSFFGGIIAVLYRIISRQVHGNSHKVANKTLTLLTLMIAFQGVQSLYRICLS